MCPFFIGSTFMGGGQEKTKKKTKKQKQSEFQIIQNAKKTKKSVPI